MVSNREVLMGQQESREVKAQAWAEEGSGGGTDGADIVSAPEGSLHQKGVEVHD